MAVRSLTVGIRLGEHIATDSAILAEIARHLSKQIAMRLTPRDEPGRGIKVRNKNAPA